MILRFGLPRCGVLFVHKSGKFLALGKEKFRAALPPNLSLNTPLALRIGLGFLFFDGEQKV